MRYRKALSVPVVTNKTFTTVIDGPHDPNMSERAAEAIRNAGTKLIRWDFFWHTLNSRKPGGVGRSQEDQLMLPANTRVPDAMAHAIEELRMSIGTANTGCYQIQNDLGVFTHSKDRRFSFSTPRRAAMVTFKLWEELEEEE